MGKFLDLTGQRFGRLVVIEETDKRANKSVVWKCKCDCGNEYEVSSKNLRTGSTKSCGCWKKIADRMPKGNVKNEIGNKYGHLTVIERAGSDKNGQAIWLCECDCENHSRIKVLGGNLRKGHTTSCGCDRSSQGEKKVCKILLENNIPFTTQYRFEELGALSFDFRINVDKPYLIEYDGETHFSCTIHGWHTEEHLQKQQERDEIKNQWCKNNNITLIRIPYWHLKDLSVKDLIPETSQFIVT